MSGFDTNPFADPVDINPFQVGAGTGRPLSSLPPSLPLARRRRDVALTEASLANGGTAFPRCGQSGRGRGGGIKGGVLGPPEHPPAQGRAVGPGHPQGPPLSSPRAVLRGLDTPRDPPTQDRAVGPRHPVGHLSSSPRAVLWGLDTPRPPPFSPQGCAVGPGRSQDPCCPPLGLCCGAWTLPGPLPSPT